MNANNENTNSESIESQTNDKKSNETNGDKSEEQTKPMVPINREVIREDLVKTAVNFLLNPRVVDSPLTQKRTFLLRKGLSLEEIDLAIDRINRKQSQSQSSHPIIANPNSEFLSKGSGVALGPPVQSMPSFLSQSTRLLSSAALLGAALYGAYVLFKQFIEPLIFDRQRKPHPFLQIQQQLDQLSKAMALLQNNVLSIESNIKKQIESELQSIKAPEDVSLHELKTELASIKALLVNRRQFAATPVGSIPLWQRSDNKDSTLDNEDKDNSDSDQQINGLAQDIHNSSVDINSSIKLTNGSTEPIVSETVTNCLQD